VVALFFVVPAITLVLALTNAHHGLQWPSIAPSAADPNILIYGRGPWFWVHIAYSYGIVTAAMLQLLHSSLRLRSPYRAQALTFLTAAGITLSVNLVYLLPWNPFPGLDLSPLTFILSGLILAFGIVRLQLFDLTPVTRDAIIETLADAVFVLDDRRRVVDLNWAAQALVPDGAQARVIGLEIGLVLPWLPAVLPAARHPLEVTPDATGRAFDVCASTLDTPGRQVSGQVIVLHDVTERRKLSTELQRLNADLEGAVVERTAKLRAAIATLEQEIAERRRAEAQLRTMQESLAAHVGDLSHKLGALYEVILFGGQALAIPAIRVQALDIVMEAMGSDAGFVYAWEEREGTLALVAQRGLSAAQMAQLNQVAPAWLLADRVPRNIRDLAGDPTTPAALRLPGLQAYLGQPTFLHEKPTGALGVFWRESHVFAVEDIALFSALSDQLAILVENARLREEWETAVVREERRRLARDLHDSVTQTLYGLAVAADTANNRARQGQVERVASMLEQVASGAQQALREMRLLLYELHLATPNEMNLADALQLRLDAVERRSGLAAELSVDSTLHLPKSLEREIYWIAMEALNNALKHARATQVMVRLHEADEGIDMEIVDDGIGIERAPRQGGIGLHSMRERAQRIGGTLKITNGAAEGTRVELHVPGLAV
jgi:signal transduction histidine kinase